MFHRTSAVGAGMPSGKSDRRIERELINLVADYVRQAIAGYNHARSCELSEERGHALKEAKKSWARAGSIICKHMENPVRAWRLVGRALENKLPINTGWKDDKILAAYTATPGLLKPFRRIKAKYIEMFGKKTLPDDRSFRRTLIRLGCRNVQGASGRPPKP